jgi:predicted  nucleic acid-binding Zn-ribbon protein
MKKNNFSALVKQEMVSRFQDVVTNEINEHRDAYVALGKAIEGINSRISELKIELDNLSKKSWTDCQNVIDAFLLEKTKLQEDFENQRKFIRTNTSDIQQHIRDVNESVCQFVKRSKFDDDLSNVKKECDSIKITISDQSNTHAILLDETSKTIVRYTQEEIQKNLEVNEKLGKKIDEFARKMDEYMVANEGFIRDMKVLKKTNFIIEKNIENLYTLMNKTSKGGTPCHKQESLI